jgi:hypothetical protein
MDVSHPSFRIWAPSLSRDKASSLDFWIYVPVTLVSIGLLLRRWVFQCPQVERIAY